ncbi:uncharacterized protein [Musca autumnalis]|uniref:uncharacterized protein n=1 Tax=Musca autumnalis TaxID=221902 RepID=UPI003CEBFAA0
MEAHLMKDLFWEDDEKDFNNFCRLNKDQFEEILSLVEPKIRKNDTHMRLAISPRTKLAIALRYMATGDSFRSLEFLSRVSRSTIAVFMPIVIGAIYNALKGTYLKESISQTKFCVLVLTEIPLKLQIPNTIHEWVTVAKDFQDIWQFPHTLGALDGKHIRIKAPANSGSQFYNFKGFYSIVLFAAVDAHCRFLFVSVGTNGKASDSTIYQDSTLYSSLQNGDLNIPCSKELVHDQGNKIPYFFIGDDAFCLDKHLMKPYSRCLKLNVSQEIFNYRLCRARMVVECAFGRLAKRFGIFNRPIETKTSTVDMIVMAACALHNYLTKKRTTTPDSVIESIPTTFSSIGQQELQSYKYACRLRDDISRYLITDGNVDFQWKKINREPVS